MKKNLFLLLILGLMIPKIVFAITSYDNSTWCQDPVNDYNVEIGELSCTYSFKIDNTDPTKYQSYIEHFVVNIDLEGLELKEVKPLNGWSQVQNVENDNHTLSILFVSSTKRNEAPNIIHTNGTHEIAEFIFTATDDSYENIKATASLGTNGYYNDEVRKCKILNNDVYFNSSSLIVTKEKYLESCDPNYGKEAVETNNKKYQCQEVDNKYYDKDGKEVNKETYYKSCGVVENPKTGNYIPFAILILFILGIILLVIKNKYNLFKEI